MLVKERLAVCISLFRGPIRYTMEDSALVSIYNSSWMLLVPLRVPSQF